MNLAHKLCCSSDRWAKQVEDELLPWALGDVDLGDNTLEIGPGYGAILRVLVEGASARWRLRRQRQCGVAAVPAPAHPRHLQHGPAGGAAGSVARGGIS